MRLPELTKIVSNLPRTIPFVGPEAIERQTGIPIRARLGANESGFGPSPKVREAIERASSEIWCYPDPESHDLKRALSARHAVDMSELTIGEGVDGLMALIARLFIEPGDIVVTSLGGYPTFNYHVVGFGGRMEFVPYGGVHEHLDGLAAAANRTGARIVYVANPDNPMGSYWSAEAITAFIARIPETCLIVLDEAYGELAPQGTLPPIYTQQGNLIRLRSFSKAYGLAGARCGYAIGHRDIIAAFDRVRNHFGVNRMALVSAVAALEDQAYLAEVIHLVEKSRARIARIALDNGLSPLPSATNFVTIDCRKDGPYAAAILTALARRGIFIRKPMAPGLDQHIRVSVGPDNLIDIFEEELPYAIVDAQGAS